MKYKLFYAVVSQVLIINEEKGPTARMMQSPLYDSWDQAQSWAEKTKKNLAHYEDGEFKNWVNTQTVDVVTQVKQDIIDTEELEEFSPVYEVELEVTVKKRFIVEIDASEYDDVEDEYDAGQKAVELFDEGDTIVHEAYSYADEWDTECDVIDSCEQ
jgi:hypothetical protein